jgi:actin-related protein
MEKIWGHIFSYILHVAPEEHNVMITEFSKYFKENREKAAQIMFETFNVHGLYMINPAVLPLYSKGKFTGFVLDLGDGTTQFLPVFDGYKLYFYDYYNFGGRDLTKYFVNMLFKYGFRFYKTNEWEIAKHLKEKVCYTALDYEEELKSYEKYYYELPDGNQIIIKKERISVPEAIFKPGLVNPSYENYKISQTCYDLIEKYDNDIKKDLYNNIVLSGGTSMFNGLPEKFTKEIKALVPESMKEGVNVIASPKRRFSSWIGGSIFSITSYFESILIKKDEYEEQGTFIIHRKCF